MKEKVSEKVKKPKFRVGDNVKTNELFSTIISTIKPFNGIVEEVSIKKISKRERLNNNDLGIRYIVKVGDHIISEDLLEVV